MNSNFYFLALIAFLVACGNGQTIQQVGEETTTSVSAEAADASKSLGQEEDHKAGESNEQSQRSKGPDIIDSIADVEGLPDNKDAGKEDAESDMGEEQSIPPTMVTAAYLSSCYLHNNQIHCTVDDPEALGNLLDKVQVFDKDGNLIESSKLDVQVMDGHLVISVSDETELDALNIGENTVSVEMGPEDEPLLAIVSESGFTNSLEVSLLLSSSSATEMYVTNTEGCSSGGVWEPYTSSKDWLLLSENAENRVYAKYRYAIGAESVCLPASIIHDNLAPTQTSFFINNDDAQTSSISVNLSMDTIGASEMYITNTLDCADGGVWEAYAATKEWELGQSNTLATVFIKYQDEAGNESSCFSDSITHDGVGPTVNQVTLNGGDAYTTSSLVSVQMNVSGASQMYLTNTPGCLGGGEDDWEVFAAEKLNWQLTTLNGVSSVYAKFRDDANNESNCISDSIIHDSNAPSAPVNVNDRSYTVSSSQTTTISWGASSDPESGVAFYRVSIGTNPGSDNVRSWSNVGKVTSVRFDDVSLMANRTYYANVRAVDLAGNVGNIDSGNGFEYKFCNSFDSPGSWVLVPGDSDYGTSDFCVMKYSARNVSGKPVSKPTSLPWRYIHQADAKSECQSLGNGAHLITNPEWMTVAANAAGVGANWSGGSVGSGEMAAGHSDAIPDEICQADSDDSRAYVESSCDGQSSGTFNQRRTHILSNGSVVWDMGGNTYELVDYYNRYDKPTTIDYEFSDVVGTSTTPLRDLVPTRAVKSFWRDSWDSAQYIGAYWPGPDGLYGYMVRGAEYNDTDWAGIFYADLSMDEFEERDDTSFRCVIPAR